MADPVAVQAGIVMLLEIPLVLGCVVPIILPVASIALGLHALAFQFCVSHQGASLQHEASIACRYLWFSLLLGFAYVAWMSGECGWAGEMVVLVGAPVSSLVGGVLLPQLLAALGHWRSKATIDLPGGAVALLDSGGEDTGTATQLEQIPDLADTRRHTQYFDALSLDPLSSRDTSEFDGYDAFWQNE